jgi:hypothetical protein
MTSHTSSDAILPFNDSRDVLSRVRQIDPTSEEAAVRGYVHEMTEAEAILDTVDLGDAPLIVSFSASWTEGALR